MSQAKPITNKENLQAALDLARKGIPVFPFRLVPNPLPGIDPRKKPCIKDWQNRATTDEAQIRRWFGKWPDAMPGIPMGPRTRLLTLDIDQKNGKDGFAGLRAIGFDPEALSPTMVATPSGGRHAIFRWDEGMGNSAVGLPVGVDVRGEGGYIAAPGATHAGGSYRLLSGSLVDDPLALPEALKPRRKAKEPGQGEPTGLPFHVMREALMALPNDGDEYASRDAWLKIGMALHCETDGDEDGREAWHGWSGQWPGYEPGATDAAWDSFKPDGGVTGWTIVTDAERHGWKNATVAELHRQFDLERKLALFTGPDEAELAEIEALLGVASDAPTADQAGGAASRLTFLTPAECDTLPARPYVIKGLLAQGDVAAIVGAPGAGKSLLAPRLGYAVAQGAEVFGRRTRQGGVFYVAVEDGHGMRGRLSALRQDHGEADAFHLVSGVSDLLSKKGELAELRAAVKACRPALVIIDTLAVAFPGLEENTAEGMGQVVAAARSLTKWGAAVILIHHDTKAGDRLPRGHSLLNGALDVSIALTRERGEDTVACELSKNRNGPTALSIAFSIGTRNVGVDEDGDPITAAIAEDDLHATTKALPKLTRGEEAVMGHFRELTADSSLPEAELRKACIDGRRVSQSDVPDNRRRTMEIALKGLVAKGKLHFSGGAYHLPDDPMERFSDALGGDDEG
ncbi:AAA family ATPase [Frigidibacter sp. MR17.14]|uniref:AAA family ATPase n=1 Tax=Frigidibacter sp. MR17.14 TaxID=3126509 RepID=UPI003012D074